MTEFGFVTWVQGDDGEPWGRGRLCVRADGDSSSTLEILDVRILWNIQVSGRISLEEKPRLEVNLGTTSK